MLTRFPRMLAVGLLAAACFTPAFAHAADVSVVAGRSTTTDHRWTTSAFVNIGADKVHTWHGLHVQPVATIGWIKGRRMAQEHLNRNVYVAGAGLRLVDWWHGAFASFQIGAAGGRTDALSSAGQFISSVGWQGVHWVVMVRHISNGNLFGGKNLGETMLMAGIRF
ncbi:MAG TPA: hypothetical protein VFL78_08450 [Rhodanobacteraceae bacterium]|nr:hypothetical protein [Rhodanobacteraceae bacterium]